MLGAPDYHVVCGYSSAHCALVQPSPQIWLQSRKAKFNSKQKSDINLNFPRLNTFIANVSDQVEYILSNTQWPCASAHDTANIRTHIRVGQFRFVVNLTPRIRIISLQNMSWWHELFIEKEIKATSGPKVAHSTAQQNSWVKLLHIM